MTEALSGLLQSPSIAVFLVGVLLVEALFLVGLWFRMRCGLPPMQTVSFLGAGAGFAVALGAALAQMPPFVLGIALVVAFVFHLLDLKLRWQS